MQDHQQGESADGEAELMAERGFDGAGEGVSDLHGPHRREDRGGLDADDVPGELANLAEAQVRKVELEAELADAASRMGDLRIAQADLDREAAEADPGVRAEIDALIAENKKETAHTTRDLKEAMVREGIPEKRITVVFLLRGQLKRK